MQATDAAGRTISRDPFKSQAETETRAAELKAQGYMVGVSALTPLPKE